MGGSLAETMSTELKSGDDFLPHQRPGITEFVASALVFLVCGCHSVSEKTATSSKPEISRVSNPVEAVSTRNNSLDLLHDLLGDEKNLSKVLIIKHASPELKQLVKKISGIAAEGVNSLEAMARTGGVPQWGHLALPPGEQATREAISKSKEHELLHSSGNEFEFQLLLSQAEGLNYGEHLARVAAQSETDRGHSARLLVLSHDLAELKSEVLERLRLHRVN